MIYTQSPLKGYQVLVGWFTIDLALAISVLATATVFPTEKEIMANIRVDYMDTPLAHTEVNYYMQMGCHICTVILSIIFSY